MERDFGWVSSGRTRSEHETNGARTVGNAEYNRDPRATSVWYHGDI